LQLRLNLTHVAHAGERWVVEIDSINAEQLFTGSAIKIEYPSGDADNRLSYTGSIKDNDWRVGKLTYRDGDEQSGSWNDARQLSGAGKYSSRSGEYLDFGTWLGEYVNDEEDGDWHFTNLNGEVFKVVFAAGEEQSRVLCGDMTQPAQPRALPFVPVSADMRTFIQQDGYRWIEANEWTAAADRAREKALRRPRLLDFKDTNIPQALRTNGVAVIMTEDDLFDVSPIQNGFSSATLANLVAIGRIVDPSHRVLRAHEQAMGGRAHYGAFAKVDIPAGTTLGFYAGQVATQRDVASRAEAETAMLSTAPFFLSEMWGEGDDALMMCCMESRNETAYFNDFRTDIRQPGDVPVNREGGEPNVSVAEVLVDAKPTLVYFTIKNVQQEEELMLDYGQDFWEKYCRDLQLVEEHASNRPRHR
jgi:hypothetical protein